MIQLWIHTWSRTHRENRLTTTNFSTSSDVSQWIRKWLPELKNCRVSQLTIWSVGAFSMRIGISTLYWMPMKSMRIRLCRLSIYIQGAVLHLKPFILAICCHSSLTNICRRLSMCLWLSRSPMMKNFSGKRESMKISFGWVMIILRISLHSGMILRRPLSSLTRNIWAPCIPMLWKSRGTSILVLSKVFSALNLLITVERLPIQLFRQLLVFLRVSLISSGRKICHVWSHVESIKILTSEWPVTHATKLKHQSQQVSTQNSSPLSRVSARRCRPLSLLPASSWPTSPKKYKTRLKSMLSVEARPPKKNSKNLGQIYPWTFPSITSHSSWRMIRNWRALPRGMAQEKCWRVK